MWEWRDMYWTPFGGSVINDSEILSGAVNQYLTAPDSTTHPKMPWTLVDIKITTTKWALSLRNDRKVEPNDKRSFRCTPMFSKAQVGDLHYVSLRVPLQSSKAIIHPWRREDCESANKFSVQHHLTHMGFRYLKMKTGVPTLREKQALLPFLKKIKIVHTRSSHAEGI